MNHKDHRRLLSQLLQCLRILRLFPLRWTAIRMRSMPQASTRSWNSMHRMPCSWPRTFGRLSELKTFASLTMESSQASSSTSSSISKRSFPLRPTGHSRAPALQALQQSKPEEVDQKPIRSFSSFRSLVASGRSRVIASQLRFLHADAAARTEIQHDGVAKVREFPIKRADC